MNSSLPLHCQWTIPENWAIPQKKSKQVGLRIGNFQGLIKKEVEFPSKGAGNNNVEFPVVRVFGHWSWNFHISK